MKRSLQEDLKRIHTLTYGKTVIEEGFLDNILRSVGLKKDDKKIDDPMKADLVTSDVNDFFLSLQKASQGGLGQQQSGGMTFQKEVESMQIGLMLLGYELPRHGVDGLFGPETAAAVTKFTNEKVGNVKPVNESVKLVSQGAGIICRTSLGTH
jgi:peptidoglycan hydrolase-like protein with peptidoglycan-binding domain